MSEDRDPRLDDCGACAGTAPATPRAVTNRPGLDAVSYRVGTHAEVLESLIAALTDTRRPALAALRARETSDFTIALLDAFACMADVLTFYQERIANESFVRTARERQSILELARLLGYELRPGVAASTYLVFRLEQGQGAPARAPVPIGTRAQSLPGPGEVPQTFETVESIEDAVAEWNELRARTTKKQSLGSAVTSAYVEGTGTNVLVGDQLLLVDPVSLAFAVRTVRSVTPQGAFGRTLLAWDGPPTGFTASELHVFRQRAALFGHNAPDWRVMPRNVQQAYLGLGPSADPPLTQFEWPGLTVASISAGIGLLQECHNGSTLSDLRETRVDPTVEIAGGFDPPVAGIGTENLSSRWTGVIAPENSGSYTFHITTDDGVRLWIDGALVIDSWIPQPPTERSSVAIALQARHRHVIRIEWFQNLGGATMQLRWTRPDGVKEPIPRTVLMPFDPGDTIQLDASYPNIAPQSWLALVGAGNTRVFRVTGAVEDSRSRFTIASKTTRVTLQGSGLDTFDRQVRSTIVLAQSQPLALVEMPDTSSVADHIDLDKKLVEAPEKGRQVLVVGNDASTGAYTVERAIIKEVVDDATTGIVTRSRLKFDVDLTTSFVRDSVRVHGNVAFATHGETVPVEIAGGGDAGRPYQRFVLKDGPLTFTPAPIPSGGESTLTLRVDGVEWKPVPSLFGRGPQERVYTTRLSDDAQTTVQFGDGKNGARLPTGVENVVARYRKGLGSVGNVAAGRLTLLPARPHGVKEVTNPSRAEGGQDPQPLADARDNAPRSVITLDRIVSLRDYEDYARNFAGIGRALASITVHGESLGVFLTIAGSRGEMISASSRTLEDLLVSIARAGDRNVPVDARSFVLAEFTLRGKVAVKPEYDPDAVRARVVRALAARFSFAQRELGQAVVKSEVIAAIQAVDGVVMVDLDALARVDGLTIPDRPGYLPAAAPAPYTDAATVQPAEMLLLRAGGADELQAVLP